MKKAKTIQQFAEENPDKVHTVDSEKLEKANKNIENALRKGDIKVKEEFKGEIIIIPSANISGALEQPSYLMNKMLGLVTRVYDEEHATTFLQEMKQDDETLIACMVLEGEVVGIGCICESHISFGVYELFWGMVDEEYRGCEYGKQLVKQRIEFVKANREGKSKPTDIIAITKSPWHLERCGFEKIKETNSGEGEVLMYRII